MRQPLGHRARSALGSCPNGRARASAVTDGCRWFRGTAGRRSCSSGSLEAGGRFGLWSPRSGFGAVGAADGQQPVSVTTEELARKPWRIMTADSATMATDLAFLTRLSRFSTPCSSLRECPVQISHGGSKGGQVPIPHPNTDDQRNAVDLTSGPVRVAV
jgi:hypothetical protein